MKKNGAFIKLLFCVLLIFTLNSTKGFMQQSRNEPPDVNVDAKLRGEIIDSVLIRLNENYVFPDVAGKMGLDIRRRLKNKEYDSITSAREFSKKLTEDLQSISHDKHLRVRYSFDSIPVRQNRDEPTGEEKEEYRRYLTRINYGFEKVERLPGNIGYVDLRGFTDPELGAETVAAAMKFVAGTDAVIFDLRQNGGGEPAMVQLICSYLFGDKPVHLNDLYWRAENRTEEFWTNPTALSKRFENKDVYVLTSSYTFSGAEEFSNNLKTLKRATIVGETTGGGANPGAMFRLSEHFGVFIPTGRAVNPITKTNWEGVGVKPDVEVSKELALKTAYLLALNKSLEKNKEENLKSGIRQLIEQTQKEIGELKIAGKK